MQISCACGHNYTTVQISCPDGILVARSLRRRSFICEKCGLDNIPDLSKGVHEIIGEGVYNKKSLQALEIWSSITQQTPE